MEVLMVFKMLILGVSLAAPVGPVNIEMIKRGISGGFLPSWLVGLGAMTADLIFLVVIFFGLSHFIEQKFVQMIIIIIGGSLLVYLSITTLLAVFRGNVLQQLHTRTTAGSSYWTGFAIAIFNPLNFVFWFGIFGSTLTTLMNDTTLAQAILYSALIITGVILWNLNIAFTVHFSRNLINEHVMRIVMFGCALVLFYFSLDLFTQLLSITS
ncbi:LysE family translocator [Geomicrobium sp. JCM 19055]|uniref:LysE family translocator n=1 Tax=Geomicrobium sp. JCM 19055 TaxID=1460649 RepID=UPI00045ED555|nr:LysE family transporter [Geomicrobium sp. JCM 19055]GAK01708.1 transporter, LysE family [Geomicrobium sp. JCM 19055]